MREKRGLRCLRTLGKTLYWKYAVLSGFQFRRKAMPYHSANDLPDNVGTYCPSMLRKYIWQRSIMPGMSTRTRTSAGATLAGKRRRIRSPGRR